MATYTEKQSTLDAMISVAICADTKPREVFKMTHEIAHVMNMHCAWGMTNAQADNVAKSVLQRFGI